MSGTGPRELKGSLDRVAASLGVPKADDLVILFSAWPQIAGLEISRGCRPVALRDGRLKLEVEDPIWATRIRFAERQLLDACDHNLGAGVVQGIDVRVRR